MKLFDKGKPRDEGVEPAIIYDTVIGAGCVVQGDLTVRGASHIKGEVRGGVNVSGDLDLELGGSILGEVHAERARISGRIEGDIRVKDSLELRKGSHLRGDVYAKSFRIQDGAIFQGNCHMGREDAPPGAAGIGAGGR